jgi:tetratricopeptide (TPR) repeat protein
MTRIRSRLGVGAILAYCLVLYLSPCSGAQQQKARPVSAEQQAAAELKAGLEAYRAGNLDQAVARLRHAHTILPDDPQARLYLGLFLYEQDKDSLEAQRYMESVADQFPAHSDLQLRLLDSYLRSRDESKSEDLVQRLQAKMAGDSRFAFNVIYTLVSHGRVAPARREIDRVSNNLQGEVLFIGGLIEFGSGQRERAIELFDGAIRHGFPPADSRQMLTLADACFQLRAFPQAARAYEEFFAHYPGSDTAQRFRLGMSYFGYGDFDRALEQMRRVKQEAPATPEIDFYLGSILIELKRPEEGRPFLLDELKRDPGSFKAMAKVAYLEYLAGQDDLCRQWLEKSLALNPQWFESHLVYGQLHNRQGQYEEAVRSLEACIRAEPDYPKAYFQLSNAWRRLGSEEKARQYLEKFNQLQDAAVAGAQKARGMSEKPPEQ